MAVAASRQPCMHRRFFRSEIEPWRHASKFPWVRGLAPELSSRTPEHRMGEAISPIGRAEGDAEGDVQGIQQSEIL